MSVQQQQPLHASSSTYLPPLPPIEWCSPSSNLEPMAPYAVPLSRREDGGGHQPGNMQPAGSMPTVAGSSQNVDDGLTSLSWLQNLNMCMTRLGAPTPPTPPASPNGTTGGHPSHHHTQYRPLPHHAGGAGQPHLAPSAIRCTSIHNASHSTSSHATAHVNGTAGHREGGGGGGGGRSKKASQQPPDQQDPVDYKTNGSVKPPFSYATLICMAMKANKNKMTLNSIYKWIRENFLYYQNADPSWQVSDSAI